WILTAVGYGVRRFGLLDDHAASVLGRFVFHLAMPAALFLTLAKTPISGFAGRSLVAFGASSVAVIGAGWLTSARWFHRKPGERAIWGMSAGYVNSANLGIPIAMQVLGNVSFLVEVVLLQVLVVTPVILIALDRSHDADGRIRLRRIATLPLRNPVILGSALGVIASATHVHPPGMVQTSLSLLSAAAVPAALIALGASLHRDDATVERAGVELSVITALKLIAQPLIAYAIGAFALHLSQPQLLAVVVCAGLPTAQNTFIFAQEYGVGEALASRAVLVTTTLSLATLAGTAALLG
ncbi:MAG TPA: AEC family transporter, partial [Micromonosporaceae bacterium]